MFPFQFSFSLKLLLVSESGALFAFVIGKLIANSSFDSDGLYAVFMAAAMLITYGAADFLGGNSYLALYILGIYLGNMEFKGKREVVFFYDGFSEIMQIGMFFILGLLSDLTSFIQNFPIAIAIMLFLTLIARPIAVYGLMAPFKMKKTN